MTAGEDQPVLVSHCASLYSKLDGEAKNLIAGDTNNSERIWEGKIIDACTSIGITVGSYSRVVNALRRLGCIEQVEQGYRGKPSIYRVNYPPTPEVWRDHAPERTEDLTKGPSSDTMSRRLRDLEKQLGNINLVEALMGLEKKIDTLHQEFQELRASNTTAVTARQTKQ